MALEGIHHITAITGDAPANVDFYTRVLGLRMIKKTVNFDQPDVYHLYYGDEQATPGAALTFFEYPGAPPGEAGDGMVHAIGFRVASAESLDFWAERLSVFEIAAERDGDVLRFADPEGMTLELHAAETGDEPLAAVDPDVPTKHALQGFHSVRAYAADPAASNDLLETLGFESLRDGAWECRGSLRGGTLHYDAPPAGSRPRQSGGTVHHVAWSAADDTELAQFRERVSEHRAHPTQIIDRLYFHSVYFREPSGVLFELATRDIGFDVDEPLDHLGEKLVLPPQHEHLRDELERALTPLPPRRHSS
jgi:glyoxalase family protein